MSFSLWLRRNSEHYLLCDAQARMARQHGTRIATPKRGLKDLFWLNVFVPVYRALPWSLRRSAFQSMPGSHRHPWPKPRWQKPTP